MKFKYRVVIKTVDNGQSLAIASMMYIYLLTFYAEIMQEKL